MCVRGAQGGQNRLSVPLGLELLMIHKHQLISIRYCITFNSDFREGLVVVIHSSAYGTVIKLASENSGAYTIKYQN